VFLALPFAAALQVVELNMDTQREHGLFLNDLLYLMAVVAACSLVLLVMSLVAARRNTPIYRPLLLPAVACLLIGVVLHLEEAAPWAAGFIPLSALSALLVGAGVSLLALAWAYAYHTLEFNAALINAAFALGLASIILVLLAQVRQFINPYLVTVALAALASLPLEWFLVRDAGSSAPSDSEDRAEYLLVREAPQGEEASATCPSPVMASTELSAAGATSGMAKGTTGSTAQEAASRTTGDTTNGMAGGLHGFTEFIGLYWRPFCGFTLCWILIACTWGTTLNATAIGTLEVQPAFKFLGMLVAAVALIVLQMVGADRRDFSRIMLRLLPVVSAALILLSWFMGLIGPAFFPSAQLVLGIAVSILCIQIWTTLCAAGGSNADLRVRFGICGAITFVTMLLFIGVGALLGDYTEFVSPILALGYLVVVNLNLGRSQSTDASEQEPTRLDMEQRLAKLNAQYKLSSREQEVLGYLANGHSASYVAEALCISRNSVKTHTRHVYEKLGIHKRDDLISLVNRHE
jgi:DNA-binding CsgD family transcriptional regulator